MTIEGDTLHIDYLGQDDGDLEDKLTIGVSGLKAILKILRRLYPQVKYISGIRVTGARGKRYREQSTSFDYIDPDYYIKVEFPKDL